MQLQSTPLQAAAMAEFRRRLGVTEEDTRYRCAKHYDRSKQTALQVCVVSHVRNHSWAKAVDQKTAECDGPE